MKARRYSLARVGLFTFAAMWLLVLLPISAQSAPYAAYVMDARTGEVLHSRNADTRLHPASLTKMMTLYIAFEAIKRGEISLDTKVKVSPLAASEPPSKLGLKKGQRIALRYLIRAAAVKSANDAATAIGEAISGSEAAFARRMNRTAKALGMTRTTFKNAHGLTEAGHLSTARDMSTLGRHLLFDHPEYYNLFSRQSTDAGVRTVANTNRRFLANYPGADGIKTGYTRAAGFNLVSSAKRGNERIIATVFGGKSTASRNARIAELLDLGFRRAPSNARVRKPATPKYEVIANNGKATGGHAKTIRLTGTIKTSLRPVMRPVKEPVLVAQATPAPEISEALSEGIVAALQEAQQKPQETKAKAEVKKEVAETETKVAAKPETAPVAPQPTKAAVTLASVSLRPAARPAGLKKRASASAKPKQQEIVTRVSTSGGRHWGVNIGRYPSRFEAEKVLLRTALTEMTTLDGALRKVVKRPKGFEANFLGMNRETADLACRRLSARNISCKTIGPG